MFAAYIQTCCIFRKRPLISQEPLLSLSKSGLAAIFVSSLSDDDEVFFGVFFLKCFFQMYRSSFSSSLTLLSEIFEFVFASLRKIRQ